MSRPILMTLMILLTALRATAQAPASPLGPAKKVQDGKAPIDVSIGHATPYVIDWDRDGKPDLLVGQFDGGKLRLYLNQGSKEAPKFDGFTFVQAGGQDASIPVS